MKRRIENHSGKIFGMLTVGFDYKIINKKTLWNCRCECGNSVWVRADSLKEGRTVSCGHYRLEKGVVIKKHGMHTKKVYAIWQAMIQRCSNQNSKPYKDYGGRGILVCDSWKSFVNFYNDMGDPDPGMTLDRRDNSLGYNPTNCRWVSRIIQQNNMRSNRFFDFNGFKQTIPQIARACGLNESTLYGRLVRKGWPIEKAVSYSRFKANPKTDGFTDEERSSPAFDLR